MKRSVIFLLLVIILLPVCDSNALSYQNVVRDVDYTLTNHTPIHISTNGAFESQGWDGYGNSTHPYIIEELRIGFIDPTDELNIEIENTDVHFIVRNCMLYHGFGVEFENVTNGVLFNNTISECGDLPVVIWKSKMVTCEGNRIYDSSLVGIAISHSNDTIVLNNGLYDNHEETAIRAYLSKNITIVGNWASSGTSSSPYAGLECQSSSFINASDNYFEKYAWGLYIYNTHNSTFHNNTLQIFTSNGAEISSSYNNTFTWNEFKQGPSEGKSISIGFEPNTIFDYNFYYDHWDDPSREDCNQDGICDNPFSSDDDMIDYHPLMLFRNNPPIWLDMEWPEWTGSAFNELGSIFRHDFNASASFPGVDCYWITNSNFSIDEMGVITNATILTVGEYNMTVYVNDTYGLWSDINCFKVFVQDTSAPVLTVNPADPVLEYNEVLEYQFHVYDYSEIKEWNVNNTHFDVSTEGLLTNTSVLSPGVFYLQINVSDQYENVLSIELSVTVNEPSVITTTTTTTTTTTDTTTTTTSEEEPISPMIAALIGGIGILAVMIVIVFVKKK